LVGKFTNGKTAVANNVQIVEGIKYGVAEGISLAVNKSASSNDTEYDVGMYKAVRDALKELTFEVAPVILEADQVGEVSIRVINKKTASTGRSPLHA
jgi:hypothetical protein